jgi:SAM-dependent methyltransferase
MQSFQDYFSKQAGDYARFRPEYPGTLFDYLALIAPGRRLAWDCGAGNGQAARGLVERFDRVVATDASPDQLRHAALHSRIEYRVERAEDVRLAADSVDLVTVAAAVHWFDLEPFYAAVRRVLVPRGVLAVWTYHMSVIDPAIDRILDDYYHRVLDGFWPDGFRHVVAHYRTLPFAFDEIAAPQFEVRLWWTLDQFAGFLNSWSATQRYREAHGQHPVSLVWPALAAAWGEPERERLIRWPLYLRVGQKGTP